MKVDSEIQKGIDRIFETGIIKSSLPKKKNGCRQNGLPKGCGQEHGEECSGQVRPLD